MNTTTLEHTLRSHYLSKADELRLPPLEFEELLAGGQRGVVVSITPPSNGGHRGTWWVAAAAIAAVTVGGLAVIQGREDTTNTTAATQPGTQTGPAKTASTIGLFPAGDVAAVIAQNYQTPAAVAGAYLADRTSATNLPPGYIETATPGEVVTVDASHAIVHFFLQSDQDSSDGLVQVEQVRDATGSTGWVVTAASIASIEFTDMSYIDGRLLGTVTSGWGTTEISVLDGATGTVLATRTSNPVPANGPTATDQPIDIAGLNAPSVILRLWRSPSNAFSEMLITDGQQGVAGGFGPLAALGFPERPVPFEGSPVSSLDSLAVDQTIKADTPTDVTVEATRKDGQLCISASIAEVNGSGCFSFDAVEIAQGTALIALDPDSSGRILVAGIVPDAVTSITEGSTTIQPAQNLWFSIIDGQPHTFTIANGDGTKTTTLAIG